MKFLLSLKNHWLGKFRPICSAEGIYCFYYLIDFQFISLSEANFNLLFYCRLVFVFIYCMILISCVVYLKYRTCLFILLSKHIGGRDFNCMLNTVLIFNFSFQCKDYREFEFEIRNNTDSMSSLLFFCLLSATILYHDKQKCLSYSTFNCKSQKMEREVRKSINTPVSLFHIR